MGTQYLAVDLGAESGRVMLGTLAGGKITLAEAHRFPNVSVRINACRGGGTLHWDVLRLWHEIQSGIAKATANQGISGIGIDTWGVDFGLLDERGDLLGNPVCYRDNRTDGMVQKVFAKLSQAEIYGITGIQTMQLNTLFQLASLSLNNSPQLKAAKTLLFMPDLIAYWLCGAATNEYTIASTSQMLDARSRTWSKQVLDAIGVSPSIFPPLVQPGTKDSIRGMVQEEVGRQIHATGIPVIAVGSHDTASAVAAVPATGDDWLYLSSGTWSLLGAELDQPALSGKAAGYNVTNEGGVGGKIRLLKNIAGLWLLQECKREWERQGTVYDYATLAKLAEESPASKTILDVDDATFGTPGNMPNKIVEHCTRTGQQPPSGVGQTVRVILQSLAATYAKVVKQLEDITGKKYKRLHIVGGGSQNNLLNQLAANATGLTVLAGPVEATALGNIMAQAIATGEIKSLAEGRAIIANSTTPKVFEPK